MCGIAGLFDRAGADPTAVSRMLGRLRHRGPDDDGTATVGGIAIGMRRLSIIDVAGGHQPFTSDDGHIAVVGNGEIYNHVPLRDALARRGHRLRSGSDIEVVLHLYEEEGIDCLDRLQGMFAVAIADGRDEKLVLARDRLGIKPLYYAERGGVVAFASEYGALLELPWVSREPDREGLGQFAAWGWIAPPRTGLQSIRKLGPGQRAVVTAAGVEVADWWERPFVEPDRRRPAQPDEVIDLLDQTVEAHLMSEVPIGVFLSGGLDSSVVAALGARHASGLRSFTVGFGPESAGPGTDRAAGAIVARHLGLDHQELEIDVAPERVLGAVARHHDDPVGDAACIPTFLMAEAAGAHVKVVLTGEGGDEAFAGYRKYRHLRPAAVARRAPAPIRNALAVAGRMAGRRRAQKVSSWLGAPRGLLGLRYDEVFTVDERARIFADGRGAVREPSALDGATEVESSVWLDSGWPLSEQLNMKLDKMTMAHSLEARVPFLDHVLFERAASLPMEQRFGKRILQSAAASLLPREILRQKKRGFTVPVGRWLREDLRATSMALLAPARLDAQQIYAGREVAQMLDDHLTGAADRGRQLWNLLAVQIWFEEVVG